MNIPPDEWTADSGLDLREYWRVFTKHKWGIFGLTILFGIVATLIVLPKPPIYKATSTLLIEREATKFVSIQDSYGFGSGYYEYYQTQYEILRSRPIAEKVVVKLNLHVPVKAPVNAPKAGLSFNPKSWLPKEWFPDPPPPSDADRFENAVSAIVAQVQIEPVRESQLVRISFEGYNAKMVANKANELANSYIEDNLEGRMEMAQTASGWLTERLQELKNNLLRSEQVLQNYREKEQLLNISSTDTLAARELNLVQNRLVDARKIRAEKEALFLQVRAARASNKGGLAAIPAILSHNSVSQAKTILSAAERKFSEMGKRYGPKHPSMIAANSELQSAKRALSRDINTVAKSVEREYQVAIANERSLEKNEGVAKGAMRNVNVKEFELQRLQREVDTNQQLFETFQTRFKETSAMEGGVQSANARVMQSALVPKYSIKPNKKRMVIIGLIFGLLCGFGLAFLLEYLDNTLKNADDVERKLDIPILGMLPLLTTKIEHEPAQYFNKNAKSSFAEAVRTIRTGVLLSELDKSYKIILVTSSVPSEGKTTLAMNLALAMSQLSKVLLIDADMRRPSVAKSIGAERNRPGLSQYISDTAKISECVRRISNSKLHVMTAGIIPPNPLEMLSSKRFDDSIENLSKAFTHIVIDCAPALAVSDALVLAQKADAVIYVVRSDSTPYQAAQNGLKRLRRVGAPIIGSVLNRIESRQAGYGKYGGKYGYYYGDYYYTDYGYTSAGKDKS